MSDSLCQALLLACLEHPLLRKDAIAVIEEHGMIFAHLWIRMIPVNRKLWSWRKIANQIEAECRARDRIEISIMDGTL